MKNIFETLQEISDLSIVTEMLKAANLSETLASDEQLTFFAPSNEAFDRFEDSVLARMEKNPVELKEILRYHILLFETSADNIIDGDELLTMQGEDIYASAKNGQLFLDDAMITKPDIICTNGIIHIIDLVLSPGLSR